ncbi:FecR family protein [Azorhizobium doebereinerae]|uniref:FecR family protein n=1 Tax=Azorhizobium doebereinerae TaxID=281091 RepID=UPI000408DEA2|nr:FecR domain-containing protein [Azorhizobium doebereinerae]
MTPDALDAPLDPLTERALEWLVYLHSGAETDADWSAFHDWKAATPAQRQAAETAEQLWDGLGTALNRKRRAKAARATLLSLGLLALLAGGFAAGVFGPPASYFPDARTAVGERRTLTLADGSQLELDAATSLDIHFTAGQRRLTLFGGRIFVAVAPDPARPFLVEAAGGTTRALGTAFEVSRDRDLVDVVVSEHAVRVAYPDAASGTSVEVEAGSEVSYAPATGLARPHPTDLANRTSWRRGLMLFDSRPLGDVVGEIERYRRGRILIVDGALRQLPVSGMFETADTDALLDALAEALPLKVDKLPLLTVIRRDPARPLEPFQPQK